MGDLVDVVADELLEINEEPKQEEQVQMVKFIDEKERNLEGKKILMALAFTGEIIDGECNLKLKENQESNLLTYGGRCVGSARD